MSTDLELFQSATRWLDQGVSFLMATVVAVDGSTPRHTGARMLIRADGLTVGSVGGGAIEHAVMATAAEVLAAGAARLVTYDLGADLGMACGGETQVLLEPMVAPERLYLFGAGHVAQALAPMAAALGFAVTVIDERPEFATKERFPAAAALVHSYAPEIWGELSFDGGSYCVVVTHGHKHDLALVRTLMARTPAPRYVGMIGSRSKRRAVEQALVAGGLPRPRLDEIHCPIGLSIGAETPAEIAVSIAAELIHVRRRGDVQAPVTGEESTR